MTAYHGGKARGGYELAETIAEIVDSIEDDNSIYFHAYWEPFCGMCGVYRHIPDLLGPQRTYFASDVHPSLIKMWNKFKQGWTPPKHVSLKEYEALKDKEGSSAEKAYVGFGYSFGGKYFGGYIGSSYRTSRTPKNSRQSSRSRKQRNSRPQSKRNCDLHKTSKKVANKLKSVVFSCKSYDAQVEKLSGWIIYCDPPYGDSSNSGFNSDDESDDEKNGKDEASESFDSTKFWKWARRTSVHNLVFVSEYTAPKDFISVHDRNIKATNKVGYDKSRCEHLYIHKKWWKVVNS